MTHPDKTYAAPFTLLSAVFVLGGCMIEGPPETDEGEWLDEQELVAEPPLAEQPVDEGYLTPPVELAYPKAGPLGGDPAAVFEGVTDAQQLMTDEAVPSLMEDDIAYAYVASSCKTDKDCGPDGWCGKTIDGDAVCHAYVGEGESCGGYMPMGMTPKCGDDLECVFDSPYPDFPGICEPVL